MFSLLGLLLMYVLFPGVQQQLLFASVSLENSPLLLALIFYGVWDDFHRWWIWVFLKHRATALINPVLAHPDSEAGQ